MTRACLTFWLLAALAGMPRGALAAQDSRAAQGPDGRPSSRPPFVQVVEAVRPKIVKIYGAGGLRGLEAYQSGILISGEGHVLTVWSYVLDVDDATAVLDDGRRYTTRFIGADPLTEIAVLQLIAEEERFDHFDLAQAPRAEAGTRVLAFSNLFGIATGSEPVSVLHGHVSVTAPLDARRGAFQTVYRGDVYVLDAQTNNPGAAGGALTDIHGRLLGLLGKEVRSNVTNTWLNFALPVEAVRQTAEDIVAGRFQPPEIDELDKPLQPLRAEALGIVLVPDVVARTPPFVDRVMTDSSAAAAGLRPDDLIVMVDGLMASSCSNVHELLAHRERAAAVQLTFLRDGELLEATLQATSASPAGQEDANDGR